jgi:Family of unknown function (DUF6481)
MKKLKTNYDDRIAAAKEAKQALLAKFKPKPTVQAEVLVTREEEKALERERVRQERAEAKEAARLAAEAAAAAQVLSAEEEERLALQAKREERKLRKQMEKAEARAKKEGRLAMRQVA